MERRNCARSSVELFCLGPPPPVRVFDIESTSFELENEKSANGLNGESLEKLVWLLSLGRG